MSKKCTACGNEIAEGVAFCTECGTKAPADPVPDVPEKVSEAASAKVEPPVVHTPPAQKIYQPSQTHTAPPASDPKNKIVGTGTYFGLMFLFAIPVIGFLLSLIMSFAPKNKNLKHFARATLIWALIGLIFTALIAGAIYLLTNTIVDYVGDVTGGEFSDFEDLFGQFGDLEGLAEQLGNGGLEGLPIE